MKTTGQNTREDLDSYFKAIKESQTLIPSITEVQKETGISISTISRYAKIVGFHNWQDFRLAHNKKNVVAVNSSTEVDIFCKFFYDAKKIVIVTSLSTRAVGEFLLDRLKAMKFDVIIAKSDNYSFENRSAIILTVSGESLRTSKFLQNMRSNKSPNKLIITCLKVKAPDTISLYDYMYSERSVVELFKTICLINEWIQRACDVFSTLNNHN